MVYEKQFFRQVIKDFTFKKMLEKYKMEKLWVGYTQISTNWTPYFDFLFIN